MKLKILVFFIVLLTIVAAFTNPKLEVHKEKVMTKFFEVNQNAINSKFSNLDIESLNVENSLGGELAKTVLKNTIGDLITREDYIFFSTTNVSFKGIKYKIGVGFFGYVFLSEEFEKVSNIIGKL